MGYRVNRIPTMTPRGIVGGKRIRGYSRGLGVTDAEYDEMFQWDTPSSGGNIPSSGTSTTKPTSTTSSGSAWDSFWGGMFDTAEKAAEKAVGTVTKKVDSSTAWLQKELEKPISMPTMTQTKPQVTTTAQPPPSAGMSTTAKVTLGVMAVGGLGLLVLALRKG